MTCILRLRQVIDCLLVQLNPLLVEFAVGLADELQNLVGALSFEDRASGLDHNPTHEL
ncbi:MAG: hypothetical protein ACRDTD_14275 [Pseudonocardiaceae bacterium]